MASGFAWACTRKFYNSIGFIYDRGILGSGDFILSQSFFNFVNVACSRDDELLEYKKDISKHYNKKDIKVGYIPTNIKHYFHGKKVNRQYADRNKILIKYNFDPNKHIKYDDSGIIIPTEMSKDFLDDIMRYFMSRNEDE